MTSNQIKEIRAAQKEHLAGLITFSEFKGIERDVNQGKY